MIQGHRFLNIRPLLDSIQARGPVMNLKQTSNKTVKATPNIQQDDRSVRDASKKLLTKDLEGLQDSIDVSAILYNSEQLASMIEEEIFEITGKNCKNNKAYREKIQKLIHNRISGNRNAFIRNALKLGKLSVKEFCNLNDKIFEDDNYFNSLLGVSTTNNNVKSSLGTKPPKIKVAQINLVNKSIEFGNSNLQEQNLNSEQSLPSQSSSETQPLSNIANNSSINNQQILNNNNNIDSNENNPISSQDQIQTNTIENPEKSSIDKQSHPRSEGPNDVRIDSQFQRLLDNNSNNNQTTENKSNTKSKVPLHANLPRNNFAPNNKPPVLNPIDDTTNVNNYNSVANNKQSPFIPTSDTPVSNINNPFSEALSSKNIYNTNNNDSLNNSIISDKGASGNKLDKLKNFLNNPTSNTITNSKNRNLKQDKNKLNQTFHVSEKQSNLIENRSEKDREIPIDNVSEIDTKSVKEKMIDSKFNLNNTETNEKIPNSNIVTEQNNQAVYEFSNEKEQEINSLREKNEILLREFTELRLSSSKFEKDLEIEKNKVELYENELKLLRENNMEIKLKLSNTNEESFRLELSKLNLSLSDKEKENSLLRRENNSLKEQLNSFDKHIKNIIEENSNYRRDIENKLRTYKNELEKLSTTVEVEEFQLPRINLDKREEIFRNNETKLEKPLESTIANNIITNDHQENNIINNINIQNTKETEENVDNAIPQNIVPSLEQNSNKLHNNTRNVQNHSITDNENVDKANVAESISPPKKILLPPPKKSDFSSNQTAKSVAKHNPIQNRFTPVTFNASNIEENSNVNNLNSKSNLFFDEGNPEDCLIFGQKKKEERKEISQNINLSNQNDEQTKNQEINTNENFLDYKVNSQNIVSNNNNMKNFFEDCDMDEDISKSKPVTGEDARVKTPNNEPFNQYLNPESGATQNIEKNNKNNLFDDVDDDNIQKTFNIITKENKVPVQKVTKVPLSNKTLSVSNQNKTQSTVIRSEKNITKVSNIRPTVNFPQKNDSFNDSAFNTSKGDNFENIFDSLASAPKNKNVDSKTNYFDD